MKTKHISFHLSNILWDAWCIGSIIGIWPRFIEHRLLQTTSLSFTPSNLPPQLEGIKIVQLSDLHLSAQMSDAFLNKITRRVASLKPDIIVFTGDFFCYSQTDNEERLVSFLNTLQARYGCYAVLGNHDYQEPIAINEKGEYDVLTQTSSPLKTGLARLFKTPFLAKRTTAEARKISPNRQLVQLLEQTPFRLLHNESIRVAINQSYLNICGLGEYMLGRTSPDEAFRSYDPSYPGIVLLHNPDGAYLIQDYPGELVLCGHTHGGQVYLPFIWKRFIRQENMELIRGLKKAFNKMIYINKGLGGIMNFRWRAKPEILQITLCRQDHATAV